MDTLFMLDSRLLLLIQEYVRNPAFDEVFRTVTHLGDKGGVWLATAVFFLCAGERKEKSRKAGVTMLLALLLSLLLNNLILKNIFARARPYQTIEGLLPLIRAPRDYSFPSGHTASSFAAATAVYRNMPRMYGIGALILAGLIAFSRLYLGVHFPTDVLGGILGGAAAAYAAGYILPTGS